MGFVYTWAGATESKAVSFHLIGDCGSVNKNLINYAMTFAAVIEKYYLPNQQTDIVSILNNLCIYSDIESSLNDFYKAADSKNKIEIISQFALTSREFVTTIYKSLHGINPGVRQTGAEQKIAELTVYLIKDCYQLSGLEFFEYFDLLIQTTRKTYVKNCWDFSALEKLLSFDNIKLFAIADKEKKDRGVFELSKPVKLDWQGEKQLDLFVDDLTKTFHEVRPKRQVYLLFDLIKTDFKIELSSKYLLAFLSLFHELHESGTIKVIGNRGLFVYLNQHLQAPPKDKYPKRDFRKLRHEAWQNEKVKRDISRIIKPLLDKYCSNGR